MRHLRNLFTTFALITIALTLHMPAGHAAGASAHIASETISAYVQKVNNAKSLQQDLDKRLGCFEHKRDNLIKQSELLETAIGKARRRQHELVSENNRLTEQVSGFKAAREQEYQRYIIQAREWNRLKNLKSSQIRECKKQWFTINETCEVMVGILQLTGQIESANGKLSGARQRLAIARGSLNETEKQLRESKTRLNQVQAKVRKTEQEIATAEANTRAVKATISDLNTSKQEIKIKAVNLESAIQEAKSVDTEDGKKRTLRKMERLSQELDEVRTDSEETLQTVAACQIN